jgi:esterase/lipase superfamily enzyme
MPAPEVYAKGAFDPFEYFDPESSVTYRGVLYATNRKPDATGEQAYLDERALEVRVGLADLTLDDGEHDWEELRRFTLSKNRDTSYALNIGKVREFGVLTRSSTIFSSAATASDDPSAASREFSSLVNDKLAISRKKDVYIYVHGYNVGFNKPILTSGQLWHFLGYNGVFISFNWAATPDGLAYAADLETAFLSAYHLRDLLELLAEETDVEQIHIIGYSAGTRVVLGALSQLAFLHHGEDPDQVQPKTRIGRVILSASDVDRQMLGRFANDGLLGVMKSLTVYMSRKDKVLNLSAKWLYRRERLGQMWKQDLRPEAVEFLEATPKIQFIEVSGLEGSAANKGHSYFRNSPWVSSDIIVSLLSDWEPEKRGLLRSAEQPTWVFPDDYVQRLQETLSQIGK